MTRISLAHNQHSHLHSGKDVPLWLKLGFTLLAVVVFIAYWDYYGPVNYLWFSDIALFLLVPALWLGSRLIVSTMAIAVLFAEIVWILDFITLSHFTVLTGYMFDPEVALYIRVLSAMFHIAIPMVILYMLFQFGYDKRGLPLQSLIAMVVLPLSYVFSEPEKNINLVFGLTGPQDLIHPWLYLVLLWIAMVLALYIPTHLLLNRFFSKGRVHARLQRGVNHRA